MHLGQELWLGPGLLVTGRSLLLLLLRQEVGEEREESSGPREQTPGELEPGAGAGTGSGEGEVQGLGV